MADVKVWTTTEPIEGKDDVVEIKRFVVTGNEYDGMTYRFSFPDGYEINEANEWLRQNGYNFDGHAPTADDLYDLTPMHWYSIGKKLVGTQVAYPSC